MDPVATTLRRSAIVDLGSNSVRLVVFESTGRRPVPIFNEKAVLRLGKGLEQTGRLNPDGVAQALDVMARFNAVARSMRADPFEVLATAAARDASNGPEFIAGLERRMPGVPIRILSGEQEAAYAAAGVLAGMPEADGILADIGGGSLELVRLDRGRAVRATTLPLGVLRLADRARNDVARAKEIVEADLARLGWIGDGEGRDLYLVGGAFRALARLHMAETRYPLLIVHHYEIEREEARAFSGSVPSMPRRAIERVHGLRRRADDLPFAAIVLRRLLRAAMPRRVVFSAHGLREGWFAEKVGGDYPQEDPFVGATRDLGLLLGRDPALPDALAGVDRAAVPGRDRRRAPPARGRLRPRRHRQPRPSRIPRRAILPPGAASARRGDAASRARLPRRRGGDPLRGRAGNAVPAAGPVADGPGAARAGRRARVRTPPRRPSERRHARAPRPRPPRPRRRSVSC